nr:two-component regulator propeller domain-containing protein [Prolixibacteraceae bacterium]
MRIHRSRFLLLFLLCLTGFVPAQAQRMSFDHLTIEDGLANNSVRTLFQDEEGYLWFGTLNGLSRYDGQKFKTFQYRLTDSTSISNNKVREIFQDAAGYLWITTYDNSAHRFDPRTETFVNFPAAFGEAERDQSVQQVVEIRPGEVWLRLANGTCFRVTSRQDQPDYRISKFTKESGLLSSSITAMWGDEKGRVWISTPTGLQRLRFPGNDTDTPERTSFFTTPALQVQAFCPDDDAVWVGMRTGEVFRIIGDWTEKVWEPAGGSSAARAVREIAVLASGDPVVATGQGLLHIDSKTRKVQAWNSQNSELPSDNLLSLFPDKAGDCWLVTDQRGVTRFRSDRQRFVHYPLNPEIRLSILE